MYIQDNCDSECIMIKWKRLQVDLKIYYYMGYLNIHPGNKKIIVFSIKVFGMVFL